MSSRVRRRVFPAVVAAGLTVASTGLRAQPGDVDLAARRAALYAALGRIRTAAGGAGADRRRGGGFGGGLRPSTITTETTDNPAYRLHPGDTTLFVVFEASTLTSGARRPEVARWFIRGGRVEPDTAWAREIQLAPFPIQMNRSTRC